MPECCTTCAEPDCGRMVCRDTEGWQREDGEWVCDDHLEPVGVAS